MIYIITKVKHIVYEDNTYKTGLYVKESVTGIGTLTYIDPSTNIYGSLGHEIILSSTNKGVEVKTGIIYDSFVKGIDRSLSGKVGSKNASIRYNNKLGTVIKNTPVGLFGKYVYSVTKSIDEKIIANIGKQFNINYLIFRFFNVSGASDSLTYGLLKKYPTWLIASINKSIINKEKFNIYGGKYSTKDHTALRDYIHVEDIANAHCLGVDYLINKKPSAILNLGLGKAYTVKEVYDCATKLFKAKNNLVIKPNREGDPDCLLSNISQAKKILKWSPKYKLEDMITSDYKFQKKFIKY